MSDTTEEARRMIAELRAKRAELGDTTKVKPIAPRVIRRSKRSWRDAVLFVYTFVAGMLLSAALSNIGAGAIFSIVVGLIIWTYLKE